MTTVKTEKKQRTDKQKATVKNLKPFEKGKSGNPNGRPPGSISIIGRIKQIFEEDPERFEGYVEDVLKDKTMRKDITAHIDGKPKETVEVTMPQSLIDLIKGGKK